jgi:ABC-type antimicrobial peptide transport system permease subunit
MSEGVLITLTGGLIGCLGARALYTAVDMADFTQGMFQRFEVTWGIVAVGLGLSIVLGLLSTAVPAYRASNLTVAEGLRHVG